MQEMSNISEPVDLEEILRTQQFSSRPTVYFSPFENLGDKMGPRRFIVRLMKEGVVPQVKRTKQSKSIKIYELVIKVVEDCRAEEVNQSSTDKRYRFDAGEEVMLTIQTGMKQGVDVYATPLEIISRKTRKGSKVITTIDSKFVGDKGSQPKGSKVPSPKDDDLDFDFDE